MPERKIYDTDFMDVPASDQIAPSGIALVVRRWGGLGKPVWVGDMERSKQSMGDDANKHALLDQALRKGVLGQVRVVSGRGERMYALSPSQDSERIITARRVDFVDGKLRIRKVKVPVKTVTVKSGK